MRLILACILALSLGAARCVAADLAYGEYLAGECTACHQKSGHSTGGIPAIIGWPPEQFVAVLTSYKTKDRGNPVMQSITARFTDKEMQALAAYFASLGPATNGGAASSE